MIEEEKKQKFKESTLEIIKNIEAEPKPDDERIK